ncbi:MAG TPA: hypothetical protein VKJ47_06285 [Candidatus Binatia bacterium]|nr:hypothetical protein [Candidatus Binatia bacterium]
MTKKEPALPTNRVFIVQFRPQTDVTLPRCEGRVEHLASGQQGKRTLIFWEEHFGEIAVVPARFEPFDLDAPTSTLFLA